IVRRNLVHRRARVGRENRRGLLDDFVFNRVALVVDFLVDDLFGWAVKLWIVEECGSAGVIDDVERELVLIGEEPRAAADHLLEQRHRANWTEQNDVPDRRKVYAR